MTQRVYYRVVKPIGHPDHTTGGFHVGAMVWVGKSTGTQNAPPLDANQIASLLDRKAIRVATAEEVRLAGYEPEVQALRPQSRRSRKPHPRSNPMAIELLIPPELTKGLAEAQEALGHAWAIGESLQADLRACECLELARPVYQEFLDSMARAVHLANLLQKGFATIRAMNRELAAAEPPQPTFQHVGYCLPIGEPSDN